MTAADLLASAPSRPRSRHSTTTRVVIYGLLASSPSSISLLSSSW